MAGGNASIKSPKYDDATIRKLRMLLKWQRDCYSALAVGAATFAFSLLITGQPLRLDVLFTLRCFYFLITVTLFAMWATELRTRGDELAVFIVVFQ